MYSIIPQTRELPDYTVDIKMRAICMFPCRTWIQSFPYLIIFPTSLSICFYLSVSVSVCLSLSATLFIASNSSLSHTHTHTHTQSLFSFFLSICVCVCVCLSVYECVFASVDRSYNHVSISIVYARDCLLDFKCPVHSMYFTLLFMSTV